MTRPGSGRREPADTAGRAIDLRQNAPDWHGPRPARTGPAKAVALAHHSDQDPLPRIVASGQGAVAEQILQVAFANGVKVREDADLVEILSLLEPESPIPLEALAAVAEILAYVYRAEGRTLNLPGAQPNPESEPTAATGPGMDTAIAAEASPAEGRKP